MDLQASMPHSDLDQEYSSLKRSVISYLQTAAFPSDWIYLWMERLDQADCTFRRDRNNYAKILKLMCQCDVFIEPFINAPPCDDLPHLSRRVMLRMIDKIEQLVVSTNIQLKSISDGCFEPSRQSWGQPEAKWRKQADWSGDMPKRQGNNYFSVMEQSKQSDQSERRICFSQAKGNKQQINRGSLPNFVQPSFKQKQPSPRKITFIANIWSKSNTSRKQSDCSQIFQDIDEGQCTNISLDHLGQEEDEDFAGQISERCRNIEKVPNFEPCFIWKISSSNSFFKDKKNLSRNISPKEFMAKLPQVKSQQFSPSWKMEWSHAQSLSGSRKEMGECR